MSIESIMLWTHLILCSLFFFCLQSFPASGFFPMSQFFTSGQSIGASASVLPMNMQAWFPLGLTGLISLLSRGLSRVFSSTTVWKHQFFGAQPSLWFNSHIHTWLTGKTIALIYGLLLAKWSLFSNTLSGFVRAFLPRSRHILIHDWSYHPQWFWSPSK